MAGLAARRGSGGSPKEFRRSHQWNPHLVNRRLFFEQHPAELDGDLSVPDLYSDTDRNANTYTATDPNRDSVTNAVPNSDAISNCNAGANPDTDPDANNRSYCESNSDACSFAGPSLEYLHAPSGGDR
jgi:hypothetical protein